MIITGASIGGVLGGILKTFIAGFLILFILIVLGFYIYTSLAFMTIAKKAKLKSPYLAWIPLVGPAIIAYQTSKMHWWPWFLIIGFFIPFINILCYLAFAVFGVIWQWKMFEKIKRPEWWALICLIPVVNLVFYGIAAWSN